MLTAQDRKIIKERLEGLGDDQFCSKGNFVVLKGFFYHNGYTAEKLATAIQNRLAPDYTITVVNTNEVWKPFRGGDSVRKGSHFRVDFKVT